MKENFVVAGSKSHMNLETEKYIQSHDTNGKPLEMKSKGSALKICMVAEDVADIYPRLAPTMEWDTAAGHAIVNLQEKKSYNSKITNHWFTIRKTC